MLSYIEKKTKSSMGLEVPYWYWKSEPLNFNKKKVVSFLLKKEKEIINKYPASTYADGGTNLPNSLTSRHQSYNFLKISSPVLMGLQKHIIKNIKTCIKRFNREGKQIPINDLWIMCWFNVLRKNQKIGKHSHLHVPGRNCLWDTEKSFLSGHLTIQAESTHTHYLSICEKYNWSIKNIPGQIIIFPTYVPHYTDETLSKSTRITVAFDVYDKKELANPALIATGNCISLTL
tara:strand:- start:16 stop:711 length:696 start_codon:yes stop_codon:yes gene_type:complete